MIRQLHRWPGLLALALVTILALSGAALSVFPAAERIAAPPTGSGLTLATLASRIQEAYPGVEEIRRSPSGRITAYWFDQGTPGAAVIDPATGTGVGSADPNQVRRSLTEFHRSFFLGDGGRIATAIGAAAMLILAFSGVVLVSRRVGGLRNWFRPLRGPLSGRIHVEIARLSLIGLVLSSITALWMTASTFSLFPDGTARPAFPTDVSGRTGAALDQIAVLQQTPVSELRVLSFPYAGDATDVFTLKTDRGIGYLDQGTGAVLGWSDLTGWTRLSETLYAMHTGQGAATLVPVLGVVLGLMSLGVPLMGVTGVLIWAAGRRGRPRIRGNHAAGHAETILLVGSEGGSTWGFASTLHAALSQAGQRVHVGRMSDFAPARYRHAERIIVLAATYGDGAAPASARGFLERLAAANHAPGAPLAVLGFGDRSFAHYCAFASAVAQAAEAKGWRQLLPLDTVDRQSPQDFARWGRALGQALGLDLELAHHLVTPVSVGLTLVSRRDYGAEVQAPTSILRFALPRPTLWQRLTGSGFARFSAGDLIGIIPQTGAAPRFYSLASSRADGFIEFVVKRHPGGLCSGLLTALEPGDIVGAFLRPNPGFRPGRGRAPLILIGAGTGIGPLAGFVRANSPKRPAYLFFGMRHPKSDFFYDADISAWQETGQLSRLVTAVSRGAQPNYVQDALRTEAAEVARLICEGARVMVCGGRDMASGVADALAEILAPVGLTPAVLKAEGRYVEDVY